MLFDYKKYLLLFLPVLLVMPSYAMDNEEDLNDKLFKAVSTENIDEVTTLVKLGADVNATKDFLGQTPLFYAKSANMVNCLVHHKADVNATDRYGATPLLRPVLKGHIATVICLVGYGSLLVNKKSTVFHMTLNWRKRWIEAIITHARFDSFEEILCQRAENERQVREKLELVFFLCNMHNTPMDIKCLILSKLPLHYLQENGKSSKRLIDLGYKHHILAQVCDRVERLQEILQMKDSEHRTPLELLNEKHQADQQYISELTPLLDESRLRGDIHDFCEAFPDTSLLSPGNLIYKMYHKSE